MQKSFGSLEVGRNFLYGGIKYTKTEQSRLGHYLPSFYNADPIVRSFTTSQSGVPRLVQRGPSIFVEDEEIVEV